MTTTNIILIITACIFFVIGALLKIRSLRKVKDIESPPVIIGKKEIIDKKIVGKID